MTGAAQCASPALSMVFMSHFLAWIQKFGQSEPAPASYTHPLHHHHLFNLVEIRLILVLDCYLSHANKCRFYDFFYFE